MAKISVQQRELKRERAIIRASEKRKALKEDIRKTCAKGEIPWELFEKLQKMRRDTSPVRYTRRCRLGSCGRPRGVQSKFGLCNKHLRELVMEGMVPGVKKASW